MSWPGRKPAAPPERKRAACPECSRVDRFVVIAQQVSVDVDRLDVVIEHVIVACECKNAFDISRGKIVRYKGPAPPATGAEPAAESNGPPPKPEESDSDLPLRFRGRG